MVVCGVALALLLSGASVLRALDISQCIAPLGMESGLIPDKDITASSCYNDGNVAPQNGRLNQDIKGGAWCPRTQITTESVEWLEVALHGVHVVTAVGTQGRFGNGQGQEFAEAYVLEYWRPKLNKWVRYRTLDSQEVLTGNSNTYLEKKNQLSPAIWASRMRVLPRSEHRRTVCMRLEIYGCFWNAGVVSYSMPQGDTRSTGLELTDATYDGAVGASALRGGLGQLVDGVFGADDFREPRPPRPSPWVGWRNESRVAPPVLLFEFDRVREFSAVHLHCSNKIARDVQLFAEAQVSFSVGGSHFQEEVVRYSPKTDRIFESARNVTIKLHHRIGRWVRIELRFAARWILISEVVFESDVAQGNHSSERGRAAEGEARGAGAGGGAAAGGGAGAGGAVPTARREDPVYVAVVVGVLTALVILLGGAVFLLVHRHRHRKCYSSPLAAAAAARALPLDSYAHSHTHSRSTLTPTKMSLELADVKSAEYQEPYQALHCEPYLCSNMMLDLSRAADAAFSDSSNYEYAVPEPSSLPLLSRARRPASLPERAPPAPAPASPGLRDTLSTASHRTDTPESWCGSGGAAALAEARGAVPEFPRHRLRLISKLAEGAFGTVYVAEADGVPEYDGGVSDKRLVAVKFLSRDAAPAERQALERDVRILAALAHPGLARVLGACRGAGGEGGAAVVLEYLAGGDLCALLRTAAPPPPRHALLHAAAQLARAMRYLEALNFVHRDLAARNVLVGPGFEVKLSDFGTDSDAYSGDYCLWDGAAVPVRWAAWEAVLEGAYSTRSDVWAFAVTMFEMFTLCRRRPYHHMSDREVLENLSHLQADDGQFEWLERPAACPRELLDFMRACWRRDSTARPTFRDAAALLERLSRTA